MPVIKTAGAVKSLSSTTGLPKDHYVMRVISETFGKSKGSGRWMYTYECEVVSPETVKDQQGAEIACGGHKFTTYFPIESDTAEKTKKALGRIADLYEKIGLKFPEEVDTDNPPMPFKEAIDKGTPIQFDVTLYGKKSVPLNSAGQPIMIGGKEAATYQTQVDTIWGVSTLEVNRTF